MTKRDVHVGRIYLDTGEFHFLVPPQEGKAWEVGLGNQQPFMKNTEFVFLLRVRDQDRGGYNEQPVRIHLPGSEVGQPHPMLSSYERVDRRA